MPCVCVFHKLNYFSPEIFSFNIHRARFIIHKFDVCFSDEKLNCLNQEKSRQARSFSICSIINLIVISMLFLNHNFFKICTVFFCLPPIDAVTKIVSSRINIYESGCEEIFILTISFKGFRFIKNVFEVEKNSVRFPHFFSIRNANRKKFIQNADEKKQHCH